MFMRLRLFPSLLANLPALLPPFALQNWYPDPGTLLPRRQVLDPRWLDCLSWMAIFFPMFLQWPFDVDFTCWGGLATGDLDMRVVICQQEKQL